MTDIETLDQLWSEAKATENIERLAEIGNTFLDNCAIERGMGRDTDHTMLARVTWIIGRMEFLRTIATAYTRKAEAPFRGKRATDMPNKFGPVRHDEPTLTGRTKYNEPQPQSLDDNTRDLTEQAHAAMAATRTALWCGKPDKHIPHAVGDSAWCMGERGTTFAPDTWLKDWIHQEDGSPCDAGFLAPRPYPVGTGGKDPGNWWCTEHQMHLVWSHPDNIVPG